MEPIRVRGAAQAKKKEEEKKGVGAPWAPGAGAGAGAGTGAGAGGLELSSVAAGGSLPTVGATSGTGLGALLQAAARITGLGSSAISTLGIVTALLAGGTLVAAISLMRGSDRGDSVAIPRNEIFVGADPARAEAPDSDAVSDGGPSALDYFAQANSGPEALSNGDGAAPAAPAATAATKLKIPPIPAAKSAPAQEMNVPRMKAAKGVGTGSSASTKVALKPVASLGGKVGGGFQDIYRKGLSAFGVDRALTQPRRHMTGVVQSGGAQAQLLAVNKISRRAMTAGAADASSSTASSAFDASSSKGPSLGQTGSAGSSKGSSSSGMDTKEIGTSEPPPPIDKTANKTPYQNLLYAGMAMLMMGQTLVQAAAKMASSAQKATDPVSKSQLIQMAQALAVAAMGAGAATGAIGGELASKYNQVTQSMPFIIGGAAIAAQAAIVVIMAQMAASEAQNEVATAALEAASSAAQSLGQMGAMAGAMGGNKDEKTPEQKKVEAENKAAQDRYKAAQAARQQHMEKDSSSDHSTGDIKGPGVPD
jgi:hypothetical protein